MTVPHLTRRLAVGLAVASATVGGVAGAVIAGSASATPVLTASTSTTSPTAPAHPGHPGGFAKRGQGAVGTVTAINTSTKTLTLRTLRGTLTVATTGSTTYTREGKTISFGDIQDNDVVRVAGTPSGGTSTTPATAIAATRIVVAVPSLMGRVQSVTGDTITLVLRDGQLGSVTTSPSTTYRDRNGSGASSSAVTPGAYIDAQGTRDDVRSLSADVITILPAPGTGGGRFAGAGGAAFAPPGGAGAATTGF